MSRDWIFKLTGLGILKFVEMGSVILYSGKGKLSATKMDFISLGNSFYKGTPTKGLEGAGIIEIKRVNI